MATFTEAEWREAQGWKNTAWFLRESSSVLYREALRGLGEAMKLEARAKARLNED